MIESTRQDYDHWTELAIRWGDVDRLGHVNNAQYFSYSEEARTAWIADLTEGLGDVWDGQQGPILADIQCLFIQQLRHPGTVQMGTRAVRLGNSSIHVSQAFFVGDSVQPVATLQSRIVWFDFTQQRSMAVPELVRERIRQTQTMAPLES